MRDTLFSIVVFVCAFSIYKCYNLSRQCDIQDKQINKLNQVTNSHYIIIMDLISQVDRQNDLLSDIINTSK